MAWMVVYRVDMPNTHLTRKDVAQRVEVCAETFGLVKGMRQDTLTRSHWHWKRGGVSGTLEVTWERDRNALWVSVHENRIGAQGWARKLAPEFARALALALEADDKDVTHRN